MKKEDIYQVMAIIVGVAFFIYEIRKAKPEDKIFLWVIGGIILGLFTILLGYFSIKEKIDMIEENKQNILKLKDQIDFRKSLEEINFKLGKINRKR